MIEREELGTAKRQRARQHDMVLLTNQALSKQVDVSEIGITLYVGRSLSVCHLVQLGIVFRRKSTMPGTK